MPDQLQYEEVEVEGFDNASGLDAQYGADEYEAAQYVDEPRHVDLTISRIDPWSVLKISFLVAIVMGLASVVATILMWNVLDAMNVFGSVEDFLIELGAEKFLSLMEYVRLPRVISYSTILGVANIIIMTALATLIALLYNLIATLVGGVRVSLMDE